MLDKRASAGAMQHLGDVGLQTRPFASGENDDSEIVRCHELVIVSLPLRFGNQTRLRVCYRRTANKGVISPKTSLGVSHENLPELRTINERREPVLQRVRSRYVVRCNCRHINGHTARANNCGRRAD